MQQSIFLWLWLVACLGLQSFWFAQVEAYPVASSRRPTAKSPEPKSAGTPPAPKPKHAKSSESIIHNTNPIQPTLPGGDPFSPGSTIWVQVLAVTGLLIVAALMSGLTIGLISLDSNHLRIIALSGTEQQRSYARIVEPIRRKGHLLLCTLLIVNMLANETIPLILDDVLPNGWIAVLLSTALIVMFGEIIPQAICSRYGLAIGAHTAWLVKFVMAVVYPITWPIAKLLTWIVGDHEGLIYRRAELKELVHLHSCRQLGDLDEDEVKIIGSVLDLKEKCVKNIMTPLDNAFMLDVKTIMTGQLLEYIASSGFSRIPIYRNNDRQDLIGLLLVKRLLTLIDSLGDTTTITDIFEKSAISIQTLNENTELLHALNTFQESRSHLAAVYTDLDIPSLTDSCTNNLLGPSYRKTKRFIGLVTLEDIVEELIGKEIEDETDANSTVNSKTLHATSSSFHVYEKRNSVNSLGGRSRRNPKYRGLRKAASASSLLESEDGDDMYQTEISDSKESKTREPWFLKSRSSLLQQRGSSGSVRIYQSLHDEDNSLQSPVTTETHKS